MIAETLGLFAGGYALLVGGMAMFQRDMIYHPGLSMPDPAQAGVPEMVPVPLRTSDGLLITGWYAPGDTTRPTIIFCHGNARTLAHRAHKARILLDAGYGVFLVGYRGYGGNPGRPSETGLYTDARTVAGWLLARGIPADKLVLYGESLGTGVAIQLLLEIEEPAALVLEAPFTRLIDLAPALVPPGLAESLMVDRYDNLSKIAKVQAPLLVLHGDQDGIVPVAMSRQLLEQAQTEKQGVFLAGGGHNDLWSHGAADAVLEFLGKVSALPG
ncbi:MAG TPA: alpha/beta hydrolase [Magnetospirillum sp.]|nr:alpha/beta hydrolase [Magnetospirillum sp.]